MFILCVAAFGNSIMIIDTYQMNLDNEQGNYEPLIEYAYGNPVTDSFIN